MNQEGEGHGTLKEVPILSDKSLELFRSKEIKVPHPPPEDQSISHLVKDVKQSQDGIQKIRKDQEDTHKLHAEQLEQQKRLAEIMVQMQDTISEKKRAILRKPYWQVAIHQRHQFWESAVEKCVRHQASMMLMVTS